jgi:hypothetical protein
LCYVFRTIECSLPADAICQRFEYSASASFGGIPALSHSLTALIAWIGTLRLDDLMVGHKARLFRIMLMPQKALWVFHECREGATMHCSEGDLCEGSLQQSVGQQPQWRLRMALAAGITGNGEPADSETIDAEIFST